MLRQVQVENGLVRGLPAADARITAFKGIPFAAPPVGDLRWRAPQPAGNWDGMLKAFEFAPISMQHIPGVDKNNLYSREWNVDPEIAMSEDCLYLNVWTPAKSADEKLPVFVWYFGGGLQEGNPAEMEFDGERIARRGIVVVTVNYRLNVFGFLAHPEITAEAPEAPTNFGHLDQQAGTRWVQRNIAAFGGDPANITIGGQSAGCMSVSAQLTSPQNEGLFQKAIMASGLFMSPFHNTSFQRSLAEVEASGVDFFKLLGVTTLAEARQLDACFIRDKMLELHGFWSTVIDGKFQTGNHIQDLLRKRWPVPLMIGRTNHEFPSGLSFKSIDEAKEAARLFGDKAVEFLRLAHAEEGIEAIRQQTTLCEIEVGCHTLATAEDRAGSQLPKYYYVFGPSVPGWDNPGAFHSFDLWFWFETLAKCWRPLTGKHLDLARIMCNYWCNFIKNGDPNGPDGDGTAMPRWNPYTEKAPFGMFLSDDPGQTGMRPEEASPLIKLYMEQIIANSQK
jgi:para-nitrobenzyl esterase